VRSLSGPLATLGRWSNSTGGTTGRSGSGTRCRSGVRLGSGRGWALWKALLHLAADRAEPGLGAGFDRMVGRRLSSREIVSELIDDLAA
jgi:hypothetical protein